VTSVAVFAQVARDHQRQGIATALVGRALRHAQAAGREWLHVDFGPHLATFYLDARGLQSTPARVLHLPSHGHDRILGADSVDCRW
jgi:GNAT superfamily N-acetyltransferase